MRSRALLISSLFIGFFSFSLLPAQSPNQVLPGMTMKPSTQMRKVARINLMESEDPGFVRMRNLTVAPGHGEDNSDYLQAKAKVNAAKDAARQGDQLPGQAPAPRAAGGQMVLGSNFFANPYDAIPNDNTVAVDRAGRIVSVTNSTFRIYNQLGSQLASRSFGSFYASSAIQYDPRITFDPDWDRWVFVFLTGSGSSTSEVIVAFSETADPRGNWNVYTLEGNAAPGTFGNCWTDYPQIGLSKYELFISGNLFSDAPSYQGGYLWQINKRQGFMGASTVDVQEYEGNGSSYFALAPAEGTTELYGPQMFFVSTVSSTFSSTNTVWLHEINDTIGASGLNMSTYLLSSSKPYGLSPDADQKGTTKKMDTRNLRVRAIYREDDQIHFGLNATIANKTELYYGTIKSLNAPIFAAASGQYISSDSLDILFPALAYGGYTSQAGVQSTLLCFMFGSTDHFPGSGCVYIDTTGTASAPFILKEGFTYLDRTSGSVERVGDYQDVAPRYNNPGEFWMAGYIGYSSQQHGTWISQLYVNGATAVSAPQPEQPQVDMQVFPNPTPGLVNLEFDVPETGYYSAELYSLDGRKLRLLQEDRLTAGHIRLNFMLHDLPSGTYLVKVRLGEEEVAVKKVVVSR